MFGHLAPVMIVSKNFQSAIHKRTAFFFQVTLNKISKVLDTIGYANEHKIFVDVMKSLSEEYDKQFRSAFEMKKKGRTG